MEKRKFRSAWHQLKHVESIIRAKEYLRRAEKDESLAEIARNEGISRQKVHALIKKLK
jgi:predicted DNA-binding protein YlxM (UPF0122 family)